MLPLRGGLSHPPQSESVASGPGLQLKLSVFQPTFSGEDFLICSEDFPENVLVPGHLLEIFQHDEESGQDTRIVLQLKKCNICDPAAAAAKKLNKQIFYVEKSIAESFRFQNFKDVHVAQVTQMKHVQLDSMELIFRDQYLSRSDMFRLRSSLKGACVYQNKKVELAAGSGRLGVVSEMWNQGTTVSCGLITEDTIIVFRSPTAMVYLFIQVSSEMFDFDLKKSSTVYEKAVDGFLKEMFNLWHRKNASHEVTIVLFSRCFYEAKSLDEFPEPMRDCLRQGYNGRFYEDFYKVVEQNERYDDWNPVVIKLLKLIRNYGSEILEYHAHLGESVPKGKISNAEMGNFLEILNMSLNTFENHYLNRNLDRTGQQSIVITPGVGLFEVDFELAQVTKQRIIDSGVGSDLICLGQQPLHAVPLLKFTNPRSDPYNMPHWINLSFYSEKKTTGFQSRIRPPPSLRNLPGTARLPYLKSPFSVETIFTPLFMKQYDERVDENETETDEDPLAKISKSEVLENAKMNTPFNHQTIKRLLLRPSRVLVNPFDPTQTKVHITSNRRRWTHIFPKAAPAREIAVKDEAEVTPATIVEETLDSSDALTGQPLSEANNWEEMRNAGVDWKSLTVPASLPLTTDYLPKKVDLDNNYLITEYEIRPEAFISGYKSGNQLSIRCEDIFHELVAQRLAQGFQQIMTWAENFPKAKSPHDIWLSIGRIYHHLTVEDVGSKQKVVIKCFRPNKSINRSNIHYQYRFQAPDNDKYEMSWVEFKTEKLEIFNWNHMDHYVCTKGEGDYSLNENLKFWRFRMLLVPISHFTKSTKSIMEKFSFGDCYLPLPKDSSSRVEGIFRMVDSCFNKLKRQPIPKTETDFEPISLPRDKMRLDILEQIKSGNFPVIVKTSSMLPNVTFLSYDAVNWSLKRYAGLKEKSQAIALFQEMIDQGMIGHASGDTRRAFHFGYVMYSVRDEEFNKVFARRVDVDAYYRRWMEIELTAMDLPKPSPPKSKAEFRYTYLNLTNTKQNNSHHEWGHLMYETQLDGDSAFEMTMQWTVASGLAIADLLLNTARKAFSHNLALFPLPRDAFALPITLNSDPVRGPIFIQLNTNSLSDFKEVLDENRLFQLRERIAERFGFIRCPSTSTSDHRQKILFSTDHQYIHCTGNMSLLIPRSLSMTEKASGIQGMSSGSSKKSPHYDHSGTGFLWSWNFMISRRWKQVFVSMGATGDIPFMDHMLADFRCLCQNKDGRLDPVFKELFYPEPEIDETHRAEVTNGTPESDSTATS
ncbi:GATOR complex protein Iml1-like [Tigriopus californicus]|uniref:GATOR complex protein Iml1-like n=1 Tax=Tigriopus californicus TaxID=6832 RepID=UPI0027DA4939|nr:GATOR complex protein Iml1-like [Tigriopus californicus]